MDETMLGGRYRRVRPLGRGAMGEVWLAEDTLLHRHVAVKSVSSALPAEPADLNRVIREARLAAQLNHPHAVAVYDVIVVDERPFVVMEFVPGQSLAEMITASPPDAPEVGRIGIAVAEALGDAHHIGLVHRDIKPANIMITARGLPKIADFGIARLANDAERSTTGLTIGTPAYLAPELARGGTADPRSDIWALGVTLYAALDNGRSPFQQPDDNAFMVIARLAANPSPPEPRRGGALSPTVMRMLAADPDRRPQASDVVDMLRSDLAAGRETRQWTLPPYALAPPMGTPDAPGRADPTSPVQRFRPPAVHPPTTRQPAAAPPLVPPPVRPPMPPPMDTPRDPLPLFGDDSWDGDRLGDSGRYGAVRTAPGSSSRRRTLLVALVAVLVLAAGGVTAAFLLTSRNDSPRAGGSTTPGPSSRVGSPSGGPSISPSATPTGTAYAGPGGITVFGPQGWTLDDSAGIPNIHDYVAPGGKSHTHGTYLRVGIGTPTPKPTLPAELATTLEYLQGRTSNPNPYADVTIVGTTRGTFLGVDSATIEFTGTYKNVDRHALLRIWISGGVTREIELNAREDEWSKYRSVFDQLVANARTS